MIVVLFRHGPAGRRDGSRWPDDGERPLTPRGSRRAEVAARGLGRLLGDVSCVVTSPLARAAQTAAILHQALEPERPVEILEGLAPGGSYRSVLKRLEACGPNDVIVLVGHEPDLGKLAGVLLFGAPATGLPLKKAGACTIHFVGPPRAGEGRLDAFLPPRVLRGLARKRGR
jgi:phosphohistidine phosphatase